MSERVYRLRKGPWQHNRVEFGVSQAAREIAQISDEGRDAAPGDEVAARVHGVSPLPLGMKREDRCE